MRSARPDQRRDLDRAVELDDLGDDAARLQVAAGDLGELGRVAQVDLRALVDRAVRGLGDHHAAAPDAEIERLVEIAVLLLQHVAPGDAEVGGAVLDVGGHVGVAHDQHAQRVLGDRRSPAGARRAPSRPRPGRCRRARTARSASSRMRPRGSASVSVVRGGDAGGAPPCLRLRARFTRPPSRGGCRRPARAASCRGARSRDRGDRCAAPRSSRRRPGPASTRHAEARRSVAITVAPVSLVGPRTIAVRPSTTMSAPMRAQLGHVHVAVLEDGLRQHRLPVARASSAP